MTRIFIASSGDLSDERDKFRLFLHDEGFQPVVWETIDQSISEKRFQDRINEYHLHTSDIVIFMIKSRFGKYTEEEFREAYNNLGKTVDRMYIYFLNEDKNKIDKKELRKILSLQEFLEEKGDLYHEVDNFDKLKIHFYEQKKFFHKQDSIEEEIKEKHSEKKLRLLTKLPPINDNFIGREDDLKTIEQMLENDNLTYIVNGIGGVGKSELSYKYLHENKDRYNAIAFIEITQETSSLEDIFYTMFKEEFALDENTTFDDIIKRLQLLKAKNLLLIDNLENKKDFEKIKALNTNFDILITTRLTSIDTKHQLNLETLNNEDAKKLFLSIYDKDENIEDILEYLDNHPLFINLTVKSLAQEYISLEELRNYIQNNTLGKIDSKDDKTFKEHLEDTFDRQFKQEQNEDLKYLLQILSIFPSIEISLETLEKSIGMDGLKVKLLKLVERGWLTKKEDSYKLHQIIRTFIQEDYRLDYDEIKFVFENIGNYIDPDDSILIASQLNHYIPILEFFITNNMDKEDDPICKIYDSLTFLYYSLGNYKESLFYQKKSFDIRHKIYDEFSIEVAKSLNLLGIIYQDMGDFPKALEYKKQSLEIREEILGEKHQNTVSSYNNISSIYQAMGDLTKALEYQKKALEIREEILWEKHPSIATSYNNISLIYQDMGDLPKALEYQKKALKIREEILGKKHPNTATSYNNISLIYKAMGDLIKALEYQKKALEIREEILGEKHPDTVQSYNNISTIYRSMGDLPKALEYQKKDLEITKEILGEKHPSIATSYNNISLIYQDMGDLPKALEYQKKDLEITKEILGEKHPDTETSYNNISLIYQAMRECTKAKEFIENAILIWSLNEDYYSKELFNAKQSLKQINFNIKKENQKKKGKFCKDI